MRRFLFIGCSLVPALAAAFTPLTATAATLSAAQIVDRNVAARGGLAAWRNVKTLTLSGHLDAGGTKNPQLPFVMKMKRPLQSRLEITFQGKTALQVYDGEHGWKVRPFLGRDEVEPYTESEARAAKGWQELDGALVDYASKGTRVKLQGTDTIEGHKAYKLQLTMKDGEQRHLWVDAANFLELKIDGQPRMMDGRLRQVAVYYRDYKRDNGLTMPHRFETVVEGGKQPHDLYIEHVLVNQPLDDALFGKPQLGVVKTSARTAN